MFYFCYLTVFQNYFRVSFIVDPASYPVSHLMNGSQNSKANFLFPSRKMWLIIYQNTQTNKWKLDIKERVPSILFLTKFEVDCILYGSNFLAIFYLVTLVSFFNIMTSRTQDNKSWITVYFLQLLIQCLTVIGKQYFHFTSYFKIKCCSLKKIIWS